MTVYCQGKQGAAVYIKVPSLPSGDVEIYEPSRDLDNRPKWALGEKKEPGIKTFLFESTPLDIREESGLTNASYFATWLVYTAAQDASGRTVEGYRGARGKLNGQSFAVNNVWDSKAKIYRSSLVLAGVAGAIQSWTYARPSWLSRVVFSHGNIPTYYRNMHIYSAEGFLANSYGQVLQWTPPTLEYSVRCGCEYNNCQQGTFPLKYCCFNCADSKRWLEEVRFNADLHKHQIQDKLGRPRTYNPRIS